MTVTDIIEISKKQCKILIDEEFAFVLYKGELPLYHLKKGQEISVDTYHEIIDTVLTKRAKLRAMNLLKSRPYTEKRLTDKLKSGMYPESCIHDALSYVKSYGYVNDKQYAADYIFYHGCQLNKVQLFQKLRQRGVSDSIIREKYEDYCADHRAFGEEQLIYKYLAKKGVKKGKDELTGEMRTKLIRNLMQKGFSYDKIRMVLAEYGEPAEDVYD